jgi:gliding motility-associated-like protein
MKFICFFFLFVADTSLSAQVITTIAGNGTYGYSGNGGPATSAQLAWCIGVITDNAGNVYIADFDNDVIRKVNSAGIISNFAGINIAGNTGDGGPAISAQVYHPAWLSFDHAGNLYFIDQNGVAIRKVNTSGTISTLTGNFPPGYSGDGGLLINAQFHQITGISFDLSDNMYIADGGNNVIRKVNTSGTITTVVGNGTPGFSGDGGPAIASQLGGPYAVVFDNTGNMYIPDLGNSRIRKVSTNGIITSIAGNGTMGYSGDGGQAANAQLYYPWSIAIDNANNIYIGDAGNYVIRKIDPAGIISTFAGNGSYGNTGDGGPAISAELGEIGTVAVDNSGNVFVCIRNYFYVIRKINTCATAAINLQPSNAVVCGQADTSFTINAANVSTYLWQINTGAGWNDITNNGIYSGSASSRLKITGADTSMNSYQYRCILTNSCGNLFSSTATLYVTIPLSPAVIIATPSDTVCSGNNTTFSATSMNGGSFPLYQWKKNGVIVAIGNTYTSNSITTGDVITCLLTSTINCVTTRTAISNAITMKVNPVLIPSISILASAQNICSGTRDTFSARITDEGSSSLFQWKKNGVTVGTASTYIDNTLNDGDVVSCILTSTDNCSGISKDTSNSIIINVTSLVSPSVTITTASTFFCPGTVVSFFAIPVNGGTSPVYQWAKNGIPQSNRGNPYVDVNISNGDVIICTVTSTAKCNAFPSATSNSITMSALKNPQVTLDKSSTLCTGSSRMLDAGNYAFYLWGDGSKGRTLVVDTIGVYYVTATDNNGCKGSDTVSITSLVPLPTDFLPDDTSICSYGSLVLNAKPGYKSYLWSDNSNASSIVIDKPGLYQLRVTDNNNCEGESSVRITLKDCMKGFYIPTAFTPNNDSRNDIFKPLLFGNVTSYTFKIYNRFGQIVFQTSDVTKGWDGRLKTINQDSDVFVWTCSYQFVGELPKIKKGSVVLIK